MSPKRIYYGFTTSQQRKLLFETWEATGNIEEACRTARVSVRLFYYWKSRFEKGGYAGLEAFESRVAHKLNYKAPEIEAQVIELRRQNPTGERHGSRMRWPRPTTGLRWSARTR